MGCREDVEHHPAETHVPRGISSAIPVHANMTCYVQRKQQRADDGFPGPPTRSAVKISPQVAVLLYLLPLLMLDEHT